MNIEQKIEAYLNGELSREEVEELWLDLMGQPEYLEHLKTNLALKKRYKHPAFTGSMKADEPVEPFTPAGAGEDPETAPLTPSKGWLRMAWFTIRPAALILAAIMVVASFFSLLFVQDSHPTAVQQIDLLEMEAPEVLRSAEQQIPVEQAETALREAYYMAVENDSETAIERFHYIMEDHPETPEATIAMLNAGILYYNRGDMEAAREQFHQLIERNRLDERNEEKVYWFLSNTYVQLGEYEKAYEWAHQACQKQGRFHEDSDRLKGELTAHLD